MPGQISSDTVFALCPNLSGNALFTSTIHSTLLSLNQTHFIVSVNSELCHCIHILLNTESFVTNDKCLVWKRISYFWCLGMRSLCRHRVVLHLHESHLQTYYIALFSLPNKLKCKDVHLTFSSPTWKPCRHALVIHPGHFKRYIEHIYKIEIKILGGRYLFNRFLD